MEKGARGNKKKVSYADNRKITEQYLFGKKVEDVLEMEEFRMYPKEIIERIYEEKRWLIDAICLVPYETICERYGLEKNTPKKLCGRYQINGKTILEIREEKRKQVEERLQAGESADSIAADIELFVDRSVIQGIDRKERGKKETIPGEDRKKITEQYLLGKSVEEVLAMEEFLQYTQETIEQYYEKRRWLIDAIRLVSYDEILQRYGMEYSSTRKTCDRYEVGGKTITEIREEKKRQIEERLQAGESVDSIAADTELFVEKSVVQEMEIKIGKKPEQIQEQFLQGKTIEEVLEMEEFRMCRRDMLEKIYQEKLWLIDAIHLVPYDRICARYEMKRETLQSYCYRYMVNGKRVTEIRAEKSKQIEERLQAGESIDSIVADTALWVDKSAVQEIQGKKKLSREDKKNAQEQFLLGKTVEQVREMEEFRAYPKEMLEEIYQEKQWLIDAVRLVSYDSICAKYDRNMGTLQTDCRRYMVNGKRITEIRAEKKKQIEERLQAGESVDSIVADASLFVDKSAAQEIRRKRVRKESKKKIPREVKGKIQEQFLQGKTVEEVLEMEEFGVYGKERLEQIYEENQWLIDAVRFVSYDAICARYHRNREMLSTDCYKHSVNGKKVTEIRAEKSKQIEERLQAGESTESIAADTTLFVDESAVQNIQAKRMEKERKRRNFQKAKGKIQEQFLQGKTVEEVLQMEEFGIYGKERLEQIYEENQWLIDAVRLVSYDSICIRYNRDREKIENDCYQYITNGKRISEIRTEKRKQIAKRLQAGESIESIAADATLFVDKLAVQDISRKVMNPEKVEEAPTDKREEEQEKTIEIPQEKKKPRLGSKTQQAYSRICAMREKFIKKSTYLPPVEVKEAQSEKERKVIETMLTEMEKQVAEAEKETDNQARKSIMKDIYQEAKRFMDVTVTTEQAKRLYDVLHSVGMVKYMQTCSPEKYAYLMKIQNMSERKILVAIENAVETIQDIEQLENFRRQLDEIKTQRTLGKDRLMGILYRKMKKLREEQRSSLLCNRESSSEVEKIVEGITKGEIEPEKAQEVINLLADKMVAQNQSNSCFALGKEQRIKQIQMQIRSAISKQAERFPVMQPEKTLELLRGIGCQEEMQNLGAVIENAIERKEFTLANEICIDYGKKVKDSAVAYNLHQMRKKIQLAEIADFVLRAITSEIEPEKAVQFWKTLEAGINLGNVNLEQVILGKTQEGMRISLADIWTDRDNGEKQKE